jgi:CRP-like cAMP-binding protein
MEVLMNLSELYEIIRENYIFSCIDIEEFKVFFDTKKLTILDFESSEVILSHKQSNPMVGILLDGTATVGTGNDNSLMKPICRGDIFGIANLYSHDDSFPSNIVAKTKCKVVFFEGDVFKGFLENNKTAMRNYLELLNRKIIFLNKKISYLLAGSAEKKLIVYLLENEINSVVTPNVSMSALADMLNVGRASLYRIFDELQFEKLIDRTQKSIIITDINALTKRL